MTDGTAKRRARRFAVRIALDTPISLRGLLHLDGLLMALSADAGLDPGDSPLAETAGVPHGSAALLECGVFGIGDEDHVRVKRLAEDEVPHDVFAHIKPTSLVLRDMSPYRPVLGKYPVAGGVRAAWFAAMGNRDATMALLSQARNLGAMGRTGWGRVASVEDFDMAGAWPAGITLADGRPARAVARAAWQAMRLADHPAMVVSMQACSPPYWDTAAVECVSPTQAGLTGTRAELATMLGLA